MAYRNPTPEELQNFQAGRPADAPSGADPGKPSVFQPLADVTGSFIGGVGKELAQFPAPPGGISLQQADPKGPVASWAATKDPNHPSAEKAGRVAADVAPTMLLPDAPIAEGVLKAAPSMWKTATYADRFGNAALKGGISGATQPTTDRRRAAETGAGAGLTAAGSQAVFEALPPWARSGALYGLPALAAAVASMTQRGAGREYWPLLHTLQALGIPIAGGVARVPPGVAGGAAAQVEDYMNPETQ